MGWQCGVVRGLIGGWAEWEAVEHEHLEWVWHGSNISKFQIADIFA